MQTTTDYEFREYIGNNPKSNFVMFTHMDRRKAWQPDFLIRKFLGLKYKVPSRETFSHCGTLWLDECDNRIYYWHQTYPYFRKDKFSTRRYNVIFEIPNEYAVEYARDFCRFEHENKRGYGIATLISFAFTLWFTWFSNPITAGKVCSSSVAASYPLYIRGNPHDVDPHMAYMELEKRGFKQFLIDNTHE